MLRTIKLWIEAIKFGWKEGGKLMDAHPGLSEEEIKTRLNLCYAEHLTQSGIITKNEDVEVIKKMRGNDIK